MRRSELFTNGIIRANMLKVAGAAVLFAAAFPVLAIAQQAGQKTFPTAQAASQALVDAVKSNDESAMLQVLGPDGKDIISSGDEVEDAQNRSNFVMR
jgi:hypothetical protein